MIRDQPRSMIDIRTDGDLWLAIDSGTRSSDNGQSYQIIRFLDFTPTTLAPRRKCVFGTR